MLRYKVTGWTFYVCIDSTTETVVRFIHRPCGFMVEGPVINNSSRVMCDVIDHVCS